MHIYRGERISNMYIPMVWPMHMIRAKNSSPLPGQVMLQVSYISSQTMPLGPDLSP